MEEHDHDTLYPNGTDRYPHRLFRRRVEVAVIVMFFGGIILGALMGVLTPIKFAIAFGLVLFVGLPILFWQIGNQE